MTPLSVIHKVCQTLGSELHPEFRSPGFATRFSRFTVLNRFNYNRSGEDALSVNKTSRRPTFFALTARVAIFLTAFTTAESSRALGQKSSTSSGDQTLRVSVDLVNVLFTVTDNGGRLITNLNKNDFLV